MKYRIESKEQYQKFYDTSISDTNNYWDQIAREYTWKKTWNNIQSGNFDNFVFGSAQYG